MYKVYAGGRCVASVNSMSAASGVAVALAASRIELVDPNNRSYVWSRNMWVEQ